VLIFVASVTASVVVVAAALTYVKILNLCSGKNKMGAKTTTQLLHTHTHRHIYIIARIEKDISTSVDKASEADR